MAAERKSFAKTAISEDLDGVIFEFADGTNRRVSPDEFPEEITKRFTLAGVVARLRQAYNEANTVTEAISSFDDLVKQLLDSVWTSRGKGEARVSLLCEAIARLTGKALSEVEAKIQSIQDNADKEAAQKDIAKLRNDAKVKHMMAQIRLERAEKEVEGEGEEVNLASLF